MPEKEEPLRPRFTITKSRIRSENPADQEVDFTPDKILYIELDDEITNVFDAVKRVRGKNVALVIPKRAALLQSVVNLKILKKKLDDLEKKIMIVTMDLAGMQFAQKAGIPAVAKLFEKGTDLEPLVKTFTPRTERPIRIVGEKVSISEVIHKEKTNFFSSIGQRIKERIKKKKQETHTTRLVFIAPNKQALFTLILVSVLLLLAIAYIALPGATIEITPKAAVLDPSFNITFADYDKNRDLIDNNTGNSIVVATFPVVPPPITRKFSHNATGKVFNGQNAHGIITVTNLSNAPWDLAAKTRFQTASGLIFRTPSAVRIPGARGSVPGTLDVFVTADEFDAQGQIIGSRGNIPETKFFLPGIKNEENKKKLYGESRSPMTGGLSETIVSPTKDDFTAAQAKAKTEIMKSAADDLKKYLEQQNFSKKTNLSLLNERNTIKVSPPTLTNPDDLLGTNTDHFEITATYSVWGVAYDKEQLRQTLKDRIMSLVDPDKKIVKIDDENISYRFLDEDSSVGKIRLTATMRAIQVYELDPEKENGRRFMKKITDHILGMRLQDAEEYLQQQTDEVSRVDIRTWPIWAPTIPSIADNIKFVIKEDAPT